jgi:hypothetical protein
MVKRSYLFIEGTTDTSNGNLREGFNKLLVKKLEGKMPTISMGDGKKQTIDKFKNSSNSNMLCDLDAPEAKIADDLNENEITEYKDSVFYMIQEMEAWFISQPEILDNFYNFDISKRLTKKHASLFEEPDKELQRITKDTAKKAYHKVKHGTQLLKLLDIEKLMSDFPEFKRLIDKLK